MHRPIPASYWVVDGLLLAEEYAALRVHLGRSINSRPCSTRASAPSYLTERGELSAYDDMLRKLASERRIAVAYDRLPIRYMGVPRPADLQRLLSHLKVNVSDGTPSQRIAGAVSGEREW